MLDCQIKDPTSDPNLISPAPSGKGDSKMKAEKEGGKLKWVGLSERMEIERMRRLENGIPDSWISRKVSVHLGDVVRYELTSFSSCCLLSSL